MTAPLSVYRSGRYYVLIPTPGRQVELGDLAGFWSKLGGALKKVGGAAVGVAAGAANIMSGGALVPVTSMGTAFVNSLGKSGKAAPGAGAFPGFPQLPPVPLTPQQMKRRGIEQGFKTTGYGQGTNWTPWILGGLGLAGAAFMAYKKRGRS